MSVDLEKQQPDYKRLHLTTCLQRELVAWANDADVVIGEAAVHLRNEVARHVAGNASVGRDCAARGRDGGGCRLLRAGVACQALAVVGGNVLNKRRVRIVARDACETIVGFGPASALGKPVRLESDIDRG